MDTEKWIDFEGYKISNLGSIKNSRGQLLKLSPRSTDGYVYVALNGKTIAVHTLVCRLFNGPKSPSEQCRHLDGDRSNNRATNLAWGTSVENHADRYLHGTDPRCENAPSRKLNAKEALDIFECCSMVIPRMDMAKKYGVDISCVRRIMLGNTWAEVTGKKRITRDRDAGYNYSKVAS